MSCGLGWVQQTRLRVIREYEENAVRWPTTFNIAATVYQIKPDTNGNRWVNDAQQSPSNAPSEASSARDASSASATHT